MKSHKIQRLEFVSDKIEDEHSKREVMCICFCHPTKKNELVSASLWEGSHGQSWSSMAGNGELIREGGEGEGEEEEGEGAQLGEC
jgi:hypothetical protein